MVSVWDLVPVPKGVLQIPKLYQVLPRLMPMHSTAALHTAAYRTPVRDAPMDAPAHAQEIKLCKHVFILFASCMQGGFEFDMSRMTDTEKHLISHRKRLETKCSHTVAEVHARALAAEPGVTTLLEQEHKQLVAATMYDMCSDKLLVTAAT
jgi:hypothetical protein